MDNDSRTFQERMKVRPIKVDGERYFFTVNNNFITE